MAPINLPNGTEVSEIVLPNGATASEVIAPDGSTVFGNAIPVIDDFEDNDISEYSGDTGNATVQSTTVYNGSYALQFDTGGGSKAITSASGLTYPSRGDTFEWYWRHSASSTSSGMAWAVSAAPYKSNDAYAFGIRGNSKDLLSLWRYDNGSRTTLAKKSYSPTSGTWRKARVDFQSTITCEIRDLNDTILESVAATDDNYDSGGIAWRLNDKTGSSSTAYNDYARIL